VSGRRPPSEGSTLGLVIRALPPPATRHQLARRTVAAALPQAGDGAPRAPRGPRGPLVPAPAPRPGLTTGDKARPVSRHSGRPLMIWCGILAPCTTSRCTLTRNLEHLLSGWMCSLLNAGR
jgi:hypothetical protein